MNPDGQKSVKDLFNGAAGVHGDIEQWRSAPHSAVTPKMPGFSPKQFKLTGFSCTTLHPKQVALLEWPWRAFFFLLTFFVAGRDWIRFGASARYLKVLSVALQPDGFPSAGQTSEMSLWLCREPRSFFLDWREQHFVLKKTQRFLVTSGGVLFPNQWTQAKDHHCHKILQK